MLSNLRLKPQLRLLGQHLRYCTKANVNNNFRPVENENHNAMSNEHFKYKTTPSENFLSTSRTAERLTSFVENIQVLSPTELVKNPFETMSDVARDRLGQWPVESESELAGQGLQRLKNGRFNKVSEKWRNFFASGTKRKKSIVASDGGKVKNDETEIVLAVLIRDLFVANQKQIKQKSSAKRKASIGNFRESSQNRASHTK